MIVFVAGPYTAPDDDGKLANTEEAMRAGYEILRRGHTPIIPHLTHWFDLWHERAFGERADSEMYMRWTLALCEWSDAVLFLGPSPGANRERALAEDMGIPIYESVNQLPEAA